MRFLAWTAEIPPVDALVTGRGSRIEQRTQRERKTERLSGRKMERERGRKKSSVYALVTG